MTDITASELKERLDKNEDLNLIDVREQWEFDVKNIGAKLIPLGTLPQKVSELEDLKNEEVIVHCKSGGRSAQAQAFLKQQGFSNVRNLIGGIEGYLE
ncbi:MAG: rhodanese-like domain-containing protein [Bacteroidota bacterium]